MATAECLAAAWQPQNAMASTGGTIASHQDYPSGHLAAPPASPGMPWQPPSNAMPGRLSDHPEPLAAAYKRP
ncbi:hypothetical protein DPEC_G00259640 [Dallia pectoralis]|uniref:Uncharacterized protein n=1 Tax=Dallia pectoralis TaxID=75939 RepID=A0ACC2FRR5_DALPE|nr:hypothetical protein DPEC_G00259640 [Dallia pectoralis]